MKLHNKVLTVLLLIAAGCGQTKERIVTNSLKDGLINSNQMLTDIIDLDYHALEERLADPILHQKAIIWTPKIRLLQKSSGDCIAYIDSLATGRAGVSGALKKRLAACQQSLQSIVPIIPVNIGLPYGFDRLGDDTILQQGMLSRIKNDILRAEYKIIKYCLNQLSHQGWCIDYGPQMMISNTRFHKGDTVRVKGWYGLTISGIDLKLTARGTTIPQTNEDPIEYNFVANDLPGTYSLPIQIQFTRPDGSTAVFEKTFKYTILR